MDFEPSEDLLSLSNPYDPTLREKEKVDFLWDFALYEDKYYVYFGVIPAIVYFLPYYLVTGEEMLNYQANTISLILFAIGVFFLLYQVIKKYFRNIPFNMYILLSLLVINLGGINISHHNDIYSVPIIAALSFTSLGLGFWVNSINNDKSINNFSLLFGSFFMALVAGCRPQIFLFSLLAIFIFFDYFKLLLKDRKILFNFIVAVIPFIIIGGFLMYYNHNRFGSVFDFGANYNLTSNDMNLRGFKLDRIGTGMFYYLFKAPDITPQFPFFQLIQIHTNYMGITISDSVGFYSGVIPSCLMVCLSFFIFRFKKILSSKLFYSSVLMLTLGLSLIIMDTQMAGILNRYLADFILFLLFPSIVIVLSLNQHFYARLNLIGLINYVLFFTAFLSLILLILTYFMPESSGIINYNPDFYFKWYRLAQFWL